MKKTTVYLMAAAAIFFSSCNSKSDIGGYIPEDAALVLHINSASLSSKITWKEIQAAEWFRQFQKEETDSLAQKIMQDPASSGIDTEKDLLFFVRNSGRYSYYSFQGSLKDEAAFESFCKKMMKTAEASEKDGMSVLESEESDIVTWKNNYFIFLGSSPNIRSFSPLAGNRPEEYEEKRYHERKLPTDSLVAYASSLYALKGKKSLAADSRFAALIKEPGDMHYWMNGGNFYSGMLNNFLSLTKLGTLLEGNVQTGAINFDNGKISIKSRAYYNKELNDFYKKFTPKNVDADALAKISSQNIIGVMAMNYPPEGIKEFVKMVGADGFVNSFFGDIGYSLEEFVKANKGDVILSVSDLTSTKTTETYGGPDGKSFSYPVTKTNMKVLFATSVNDKAAFDKLVSAAQQQFDKLSGGEVSNELPEISYTLKDGWFVAGNSKEQVDAYTAGNKNNHAFIEKIKGHPICLYIDLQKLIDGFGGMTAEEDHEKKMLDASKKMWHEVVMTSDAFESNMEIHLADKNTNSLKQLNGYFDSLTKIMNERRQQMAGDTDFRPVPDTTTSAEAAPVK